MTHDDVAFISSPQPVQDIDPIEESVIDEVCKKKRRGKGGRERSVTHDYVVLRARGVRKSVECYRRGWRGAVRYDSAF